MLRFGHRPDRRHRSARARRAVAIEIGDHVASRSPKSDSNTWGSAEPHERTPAGWSTARRGDSKTVSRRATARRPPAPRFQRSCQRSASTHDSRGTRGNSVSCARRPTPKGHRSRGCRDCTPGTVGNLTGAVSTECPQVRMGRERTRKDRDRYWYRSAPRVGRGARSTRRTNRSSRQPALFQRRCVRRRQMDITGRVPRGQ